MNSSVDIISSGLNGHMGYVILDYEKDLPLWSMFMNTLAQVCGILGVIGFAVFVIGGSRDDDGQGTNSSPFLKK